MRLRARAPLQHIRQSRQGALAARCQPAAQAGPGASIERGALVLAVLDAGFCLAAGIGQGMIRLAAGLEHLDDMKADLLRGLDTL